MTHRQRLLLAGLFLAILLALVVRDRPASPPEPPATPAPTSMAERLAGLVAAADPRANPYLNAGRVAWLGAELAKHSDPAQAMDLWVRYARELLLVGRTLDAIQQLERIQQVAKQNPTTFQPTFAYLLRDELAVAYLRLGEQENCIAQHAPEACFLPIRGSGIHAVERGSRAAIRAYTDILTDTPQDLGARWLLNVAYMTVGEWPEGVPAAWRIPPAAFESEYLLGHFAEVAARAGVDAMGLAGGSIMEDFDRDGLLDLMCSSWGISDQMRYFRNAGDGTFTDLTDAAGLSGLVGGLNMVHADYNNDGYADVLVLRGAWWGEAGRYPNSLLRNNGDGTFTDVTESAGLLSFHPTQTAAWGDYDNDGLLDLFIGNESGNFTYLYTGEDRDREDAQAGPVGRHACELYRNNGDGTFTNVAAEAGVAHVGFVKGTAWGDYDNDGDVDLFLSLLLAPNVLYRNNGDGTFSDVTATAGVQDPAYSFPTWFFDYDNDGWLDLFVAGYSTSNPGDIGALYLGRAHGAEHPRLYRNNRDGTFTDVTEGSGVERALLAMGANYGDLDNDGYLDVYIGNGTPNYRMLLPNVMLRNDAGRRFQDVTTVGGFGNVQKGHGVAFGDLDNDGDQDLYVVMGGAYQGDTYTNLLFLNPGHGHRWVTLQLEGVRANRAAIGARIRVRVRTPAGSRDVHVVAGTGGSFGSSSLQQEIGLGDATAIESVEIRWPGSGLQQELTGVELEQAYRIREGDPTPQPLKLRRVAAPPQGMAHQHGAPQ